MNKKLTLSLLLPIINVKFQVVVNYLDIIVDSIFKKTVKNGRNLNASFFPY